MQSIKWIVGILVVIAFVVGIILLLAHGVNRMTAVLSSVTIVHPREDIECVIATTANGVAMNCRWK